MPSLVEISPAVLERKIFFIFNFDNVFSLFHNYFPLEKERALHLNKLESSSPKDALNKFGWNWPTGSGEEVFFKLILTMYFRYFIIICPWKKVGLFIWINLNPCHPRCFVPCLVEIGPVVLEKKWKCEQFTTTTTDNRQILIRKVHLSLWLRWANNIAHHLHKTQPPRPLHPGIPLCQVWLKVILLFCKRVPVMIPSLTKGHHGLLFEETWIPCFLSSLIEIGQVVQDTKKNKTVYKTDKKTTGDKKKQLELSSHMMQQTDWNMTDLSWTTCTYKG